MSQGRRAILRTRPRRDPRASVIALVIQLAVVVVLARMVVFPAAMDLFGGLSDLIREQRVTYVVPMPAAATGVGDRVRDGGNGRPPSTAAERASPVEPIAAPSAVPSTMPIGEPVRPGRAVLPGSGSGPVIGGGGPLQGIQPGFNDPRLWPTPQPYEEPRPFPMTRADSLEAVLHAYGERFIDSVSRSAPIDGQPGQWTWQRNGRTYGIDPQYIRLGKYSIPTVLLALLPLNITANPQALERAQRLAQLQQELDGKFSSRAGIDRQGRDDEFHAAVRALRERKERERREAEAARRGATSGPSTTGASRPPLP